jgi:hypothetical protein
MVCARVVFMVLAVLRLIGSKSCDAVRTLEYDDGFA